MFPFSKKHLVQDALERRSLSSAPSPLPQASQASSSVPPSSSPSSTTGHTRSNSISTSHIYPAQSPSESRRKSLQTMPSITSTLPRTQTSPFVTIPPKKQYTGSPGSSLQRQNVVTSSDLGSSTGDDFGTSELSQTLVSPSVFTSILCSYHFHRVFKVCP